MDNIFNYIENYGGSRFYEKEFNSIDALILAQLSYIPFDGIVKPSLKSAVTTDIASSIFFKNADFSSVIWKNDPKLLVALAKSRRFKDIRISGYINEIDKDNAKQFSAVVFELRKNLRFIAFRGTDHSFAGWEEDFTLYSRSVLPSQKQALSYFEKAAGLLNGDFIIGGHSKGGNLALYVYEHIHSQFKSRIKSVYNFDGPSLNKEIISEKVKVFVPQSSVFGIMLNQGENYSIVKSRGASFIQHDITNWEIKNDDFVYAARRSGTSRYIERALNDFVDSLNQKQRKDFINALFKVFSDTEKADFDEVLKNPAVIVQSFFRQNKRKRSVILNTFGKVIRSAGINIFRQN
jgi:hypothetical protein